MSVINTSDKKKVIVVAENGTPITGAMVDEWCAAYDRGELPDGYSFEREKIDLSVDVERKYDKQQG